VRLSSSNTYSLYRFSTNRPVAALNEPGFMFYNYQQNFLPNPNGTNYSHLLDGVVGFRVQAFDANGGLILTNRMNIYTNAPTHSIYFFSNALPASVEIEMATIEDRSLQRAESLPFFTARSNYLSQQAGKVHVFRQRVAIPNVDPSVYQ
jgi:hypothetical protein